MSFGEGHNVYNDIPGFDASKGERIVKALQRLWAKIEHLEQIRNSERQLRSKEVQMSSNDEDLTISEVQYKLLVLQLKYIRSIVRKNWDTSHSDGHDQVPAHITDLNEGNYANNQNTNDIPYSNDFENHLICVETQTGNSLIEGVDPFVSMHTKRSQDKVDAQVSTDISSFKFGDSATNTASISQKTLPTCSRPHYHVKFDEVPFILGASTASHSVVAAVQNIIAQMKTHNRALCGPRHHVQQSTISVNTRAPETDSRETSKMLNDLSKELHDLGLKQAALAKRFEETEGTNQMPSAHKVITAGNKSQINKTGCVNMTAMSFPERSRTLSESTKLKAAVTNTSKNRQGSSNIKCQSNTHPGVARLKFLRSLQNFKSHLSEGDISWK